MPAGVQAPNLLLKDKLFKVKGTSSPGSLLLHPADLRSLGLCLGGYEKVIFKNNADVPTLSFLECEISLLMEGPAEYSWEHKELKETLMSAL